MIENMPTPIDHIDHMRPRKTLHGRAPKDQRGNRDARKRWRILDSLTGGRKVTK